ncbi:filamentous hemagglutinin N-terminal domain-containing protein [Morganella morganii]|uniref:two-partner secretion domain-containing protein n=1 Tax=Morganella morganii TaxID=582 RepID=UPI0016487618|nr:filamentous hemagglutinin N-terminal domain-containing protein [Morganella morganii]MBC3980341.1 filamentous hemagglutinin N-terminal domain-containing protein [Morganella morganii]
MPKIVKLSVISSALFLAQFASATDITVNPVSSETTQIVRQGSNTTINIAPANTQGVSYNAYDKFNVGKHGVVFNNRESGAGIIINEVLSTEKSQLRGNMHVDGQKAHLIIANPNGIACNGCSVSGADQLTLTGGKIVFSLDGELLGYHNSKNNSNIRISNTTENAFSSVNKFNVIAENITIRNSEISTPNLVMFSGHELVKYSPDTVRGLEALPGSSGAEKSKLAIRKDSHIKTDNMYISANNTDIKNHGIITVGPVGDAQKQHAVNSQLTLDLVNSHLMNGSKGNIRVTDADSILENSQITNNGNIHIDNKHKMLAIGSAVIHNKGNMSSDITEITSLNNVKSGVDINNYGNLTGSLLVKANQIAFNNKKYLEALDISADSDVLAYINDGEIMNETAKFRAYELYHSGNGKITSVPVFESEIKKPLQ